MATSRNAFVRTSDRIAFRRCRRKFLWSYSGSQNLGAKDGKIYFWFGSGGHFALEDFHGWKQFETPYHAFEAYAKANLPPGGDPSGEHLGLAKAILDYYLLWLRRRAGLNTLWLDGRPCVEVRFRIEIPQLRGLYGYERVYYTGTIDRIVQDDFGRIWYCEYKFPKRFEEGHFDTDPQISAYSWALAKLFPQYTIGGVIYQQHKKFLPHPPEFLKTTRQYSVNKQQATTYALYAEALATLYGSINRAPEANRRFLDHLDLEENQDKDKFILRTYAERSEAQIASEEAKILLELPELLNPDLPAYPTPTRDCSWDCDFHQACINMDDGGDYEFELDETCEQRTENDQWRLKLRPQQPPSEPLPVTPEFNLDILSTKPLNPIKHRPLLLTPPGQESLQDPFLSLTRQ